MSRTNAYRQSSRARLTFLACACLLLAACTSDEPAPPDLSLPGAAQMPVPSVTDDVHGRAVRGLASHDFEVRTRAARELVAAGDAAVPALGRAGDLSVPVAGGMRVSATRSVLLSILARSDEGALERHLGSPWPNVRRTAAEELGRRERWSAIPRLIERLDDTDLEVRAASAVSLRRVTNQFLGYDPDDSLGDRREAADRWRAWWARDGRSRLPDRPTAPGLTAHAR
ncbi:MAG: HEAT repeat domain-containing protein [Planctomycetota bacterium]|nr:HEAT repeat domain-containing protein [Planctomycetota bacterium]